MTRSHAVITISPNTPTVLKEYPYASQDNRAGYLWNVRPGDLIKVTRMDPELQNGHYALHMAKTKGDGASPEGLECVYAYREHFDVFRGLPGAVRPVSDMSTNTAGVELLKHFEGCELSAYRCPAGVWTVGYGHTDGVRSGQTLTEEEADALLKRDLVQYENAVKRCVTVQLTANQFSALVVWTYNNGSGALAESTMLKRINAQAGIESITSEMRRWVYAGGRVLPGLVRRRTAESKLYTTK